MKQKGIVERIKAAETKKELAKLVGLVESWEDISPKTKRRALKYAEKQAILIGHSPSHDHTR